MKCSIFLYSVSNEEPINMRRSQDSPGNNRRGSRPTSPTNNIERPPSAAGRRTPKSQSTNSFV